MERDYFRSCSSSGFTSSHSSGARQTLSSVRPAGGAGMPRSIISFRRSAPGLGLNDGRLRADPDQAVGVIDRQPGVLPEPSARVVAVHAEVSRVDLGAGVNQYLNDLRAAFVSRAVQRRPPGLGLGVRIVAETKEHLDGLDVGLNVHDRTAAVAKAIRRGILHIQ